MCQGNLEEKSANGEDGSQDETGSRAKGGSRAGGDDSAVRNNDSSGSSSGSSSLGAVRLARISGLGPVLSRDGRAGVEEELGVELRARDSDVDVEGESSSFVIRLSALGLEESSVFESNVEAGADLSETRDKEVAASGTSNEGSGGRSGNVVSSDIASSGGHGTNVLVGTSKVVGSSIELLKVLGDNIGIVVVELVVGLAVVTVTVTTRSASGDRSSTALLVFEAARNNESDTMTEDPGFKGQGTKEALGVVSNLRAEDLAILTVGRAEGIRLTRALGGSREEAVTPTVRLTDKLGLAAAIAAPHLVAPPDLPVVATDVFNAIHDGAKLATTVKSMPSREVTALRSSSSNVAGASNTRSSYRSCNGCQNGRCNRC